MACDSRCGIPSVAPHFGKGTANGKLGLMNVTSGSVRRLGCIRECGQGGRGAGVNSLHQSCYAFAGHGLAVFQRASASNARVFLVGVDSGVGDCTCSFALRVRCRRVGGVSSWLASREVRVGLGAWRFSYSVYVTILCYACGAVKVSRVHSGALLWYATRRWYGRLRAEEPGWPRFLLRRTGADHVPCWQLRGRMCRLAGARRGSPCGTSSATGGGAVARRRAAAAVGVLWTLLQQHSWWSPDGPGLSVQQRYDTILSGKATFRPTTARLSFRLASILSGWWWVLGAAVLPR